MAVQLARRLTALTVVGTASRPESAQWVRDLGAHHVIDHSRPLSEEMARIGLPQADAIFAYRTEIAWDAGSAQLVFREAERLDAPFAQTGTVSVSNQSGHIYLVTEFQGQYRLAMLGRPTIQGEMFGILTTLVSGRGAHLTPAATPLALLPERTAPAAHYGRILPGMACEQDYRRFLDRVRDDGFAVFPGCLPPHGSAVG